MFDDSGSSGAPMASRPAYMTATSMVDEQARDSLSGIPHATQPNLKFEEEEMAERNSARLEEAVDWLHAEKSRVSIHIGETLPVNTRSPGYRCS